MTDAPTPKPSDSQVIADLARAIYGRVIDSEGTVVWMREASRAMGLSIGQVQAMVKGRQPSEKLRLRLKAWLAMEVEREHDSRRLKRLLMREARKRLS